MTRSYGLGPELARSCSKDLTSYQAVWLLSAETGVENRPSLAFDTVLSMFLLPDPLSLLIQFVTTLPFRDI